MTTSKIVAEFPGPPGDGTTGIVIAAQSGKFHAALRDDETGNIACGVIRICDTLEKASDVARKWANA